MSTSHAPPVRSARRRCTQRAKEGARRAAAAGRRKAARAAAGCQATGCSWLSRARGALAQEPGLDVGPGGGGLQPPAGAGVLDAQRPGRAEESLQGPFQGRGGRGLLERDAQGTGLDVEAPAGHGGRSLGVFLQVVPGLGGGNGPLQADGGGLVPAHLQIGGGQGLLDAAAEEAAAHAGVLGGHVGGEGDDVGLPGDGLHDAAQAEGGQAKGGAAVRFVGGVGALAFGFGGGAGLHPASLLRGRAREGLGPGGCGIRLHPGRIRCRRRRWGLRGRGRRHRTRGGHLCGRRVRARRRRAGGGRGRRGVRGRRPRGGVIVADSGHEEGGGATNAAAPRPTVQLRTGAFGILLREAAADVGTHAQSGQARGGGLGFGIQRGLRRRGRRGGGRGLGDVAAADGGGEEGGGVADGLAGGRVESLVLRPEIQLALHGGRPHGDQQAAGGVGTQAAFRQTLNQRVRVALRGGNRRGGFLARAILSARACCIPTSRFSESESDLGEKRNGRAPARAGCVFFPPPPPPLHIFGPLRCRAQPVVGRAQAVGLSPVARCRARCRSPGNGSSVSARRPSADACLALRSLPLEAFHTQRIPSVPVAPVRSGRRQRQGGIPKVTRDGGWRRDGRFRPLFPERGGPARAPVRDGRVEDRNPPLGSSCARDRN